MKLRIVTLTIEYGRLKDSSEGGDSDERADAELPGWLDDDCGWADRLREAALREAEDEDEAGCVSGTADF